MAVVHLLNICPFLFSQQICDMIYGERVFCVHSSLNIVISFCFFMHSPFFPKKRIVCHLTAWFQLIIFFALAVTWAKYHLGKAGLLNLEIYVILVALLVELTTDIGNQATILNFRYCLFIVDDHAWQSRIFTWRGSTSKYLQQGALSTACTWQRWVYF